MPLSTPLNAVLPLISGPRLGSYIVTFKPVDDHELYGIYVWSQLAAGALYPLLQNLEITAQRGGRGSYQSFRAEVVGLTRAGL
ncbi:hypothetical protein [Pantoea ananatis]|uniref:hypothetical protein n=1 Tax=Pantoea ananas TaxID=553 RepID=UPI001FF08189|nr:hypothetical protein [Pantoea ananatis]